METSRENNIVETREHRGHIGVMVTHRTRLGSLVLLLGNIRLFVRGTVLGKCMNGEKQGVH